MPNLQYTFLGSEDNPERGTYTPLIVPGTVGQEINSLDTAPGVGNTVNPDGTTTIGTQASNVTPFSKIKNYLLKSIEDGSYQNLYQEEVNVLNDYFWTISPKNSKIGRDSNKYRENNYNNVNDEVPYIYLKEKYFLVNNIVAQALYTLSSSLDALGPDVVNSIKEDLTAAQASLRRNLVELQPVTDPYVGPVLDSPTFQATTQAVQDAGNRMLDAAGTLASSSNTLTNVSNVVSKTLDAFGAKDLMTLFFKYNNPDLEDVLFPYQRLYIVGPTGFNYKIPYLNSNVLNINNNFSEGGGGNLSGMIQNLVDSGSNVVELFAGTTQLLSQAGSSKIERTKNFQYPTGGDPINIVLPLYNTRPSTFNDVCNNFKLVMLLLYQNLPLRQDKIIVEPPVLYDVTIPGNRREPYCYMSSITINYKGATRLMEIPTTGIQSIYNSTTIAPFIKAIIPDMYEIKMQLQPMIASTKNLLFTQIQNPVVKYGYQDVQSVLSQSPFITNSIDLNNGGTGA